MTKNEFLLNVAIRAMGWGEGADFEMRELIGYEDELSRQLEKHYNVIEPNDERGWDEELYDSLEAQDQEQYEKTFLEGNEKERIAWEKALDQCQKDAIALLRQIKKQYECPIYAQAQMEKDLANMEKNANNPKFYLKGKLEAIALYRRDKNASLKDAYEYVTDHGWTKDGQYK